MKLIDADELKESFRWSEVCRLSKLEILKIIDDAKPVDISTKLSCAYIKGRMQGRSERRSSAGAWLWVGGDRIKWSCSRCGRGVGVQENFCPQCGLRMKVVRGNYTCT